jgi:flagellar basal-body rod protein FlgB
MDYHKIPLLSALVNRMDWLGQRQRVLAENVANADTPGYQPRDLKPQSFSDLLGDARGRLGMAATSPRHLAPGAASGGGEAPRKVDRGAYETAPAGNAVILEQQLMRVADTQLQHQTITSLYRKHVGMLKLALGRGGN